MLAAHTSAPTSINNAIIARMTNVRTPKSSLFKSPGGCDALGGDGLGLGGGVSCVGRFGGRGGGAGREDEPAASFLSYSVLLAGSLRTSHASFSSLVVASAVGLGFRSG